MKVIEGDCFSIIHHDITQDCYEEPLGKPQRVHLYLQDNAIWIGLENLPGAEEPWNIEVSSRIALEYDSSSNQWRVLVWADGNEPDPVVLPITRRDYDPEFDPPDAKDAS